MWHSEYHQLTRLPQRETPARRGRRYAGGGRRTRQPLFFFELDFFAETLLLDECDDFAIVFDLLDLDLLALALLALALLDFECDACTELFP